MEVRLHPKALASLQRLPHAEQRKAVYRLHRLHEVGFEGNVNARWLTGPEPIAVLRISPTLRAFVLVVEEGKSLIVDFVEKTGRLLGSLDAIRNIVQDELSQRDIIEVARIWESTTGDDALVATIHDRAPSAALALKRHILPSNPSETWAAVAAIIALISLFMQIRGVNYDANVYNNYIEINQHIDLRTGSNEPVELDPTDSGKVQPDSSITPKAEE